MSEEIGKAIRNKRSPYATSAEKLRRMISQKDVKAILDVVIKQALEGDLFACRIILERTIPTLKSVELKIEQPQEANTIRIIDAMQALEDQGELDN